MFKLPDSRPRHTLIFILRWDGEDQQHLSMWLSNSCSRSRYLFWLALRLVKSIQRVLDAFLGQRSLWVFCWYLYFPLTIRNIKTNSISSQWSSVSFLFPKLDLNSTADNKDWWSGMFFFTGPVLLLLSTIFEWIMGNFFSMMVMVRKPFHIIALWHAFE